MNPIIGRNVRAGHTPGGFSSVLGQRRNTPKRRQVSMQQVRDAANKSLARRGALVQPDIFDCKGNLSR